MKKILAILTCIMVLLLSAQSFAAGWVSKNKITKIAFQSEHVFIYSDGWNNANGCQKISAVVLDKDDRNFDKAYSLLLAAFMAGKEVSGYSDGCITWDEHSYEYYSWS